MAVIVKVDGVPIHFDKNKVTVKCLADVQGKYKGATPTEFPNEDKAGQFIDMWKVRRAVIVEVNNSQMAYA